MNDCFVGLPECECMEKRKAGESFKKKKVSHHEFPSRPWIHVSDEIHDQGLLCPGEACQESQELQETRETTEGCRRDTPNLCCLGCRLLLEDIEIIIGVGFPDFHPLVLSFQEFPRRQRDSSDTVQRKIRTQSVQRLGIGEERCDEKFHSLSSNTVLEQVDMNPTMREPCHGGEHREASSDSTHLCCVLWSVQEIPAESSPIHGGKPEERWIWKLLEFEIPLQEELLVEIEPKLEAETLQLHVAEIQPVTTDGWMGWDG